MIQRIENAVNTNLSHTVYPCVSEERSEMVSVAINRLPFLILHIKNAWIQMFDRYVFRSRVHETNTINLELQALICWLKLYITQWINEFECVVN